MKRLLLAVALLWAYSTAAWAVSCPFTVGAKVGADQLNHLTAQTTVSTSTSVADDGYDLSYFFNHYATAGTAVTYTLPTAALCKSKCFRQYTGNTGAITIQTSAAGQYIDQDGTASASGGYVVSGGALGDAACVVAADTTHWFLYVSKGTWTLH